LEVKLPIKGGRLIPSGQAVDFVRKQKFLFIFNWLSPYWAGWYFFCCKSAAKPQKTPNPVIGV
jgi:hypothetical protein